ncbi:MAG: hypothetical protein HC908_05810 [Calothrix sp. SM1_7_51]|nr:hypothetical protein [Calothrix sp. SM1_7_51]
MICQQLGLSLGLWQGEFRGIDKLWLRWFTLEGEIIPFPEEEVAESQNKKLSKLNRRRLRLK